MQLQEGQLTDLVAKVNFSVEELNASPVIGEITLQAETSQKRTGELTLLVEAELEKLKAIDDEYRAARMEAVSDYRKAQQAFSQAERAARDDRGSRDYAKRLARIVEEELAGSAIGSGKKSDDGTEGDVEEAVGEFTTGSGLWEMDARHYDALAEAMKFLSETETLGESAEQLRQEYLGQAQQARKSISDLDK